MTLNRRVFFADVRQSVFRGRMSKSNVDGLDSLLDIWDRDYGAEDHRWLAYCLGTSYHETAHTMQPIEEYGSNARANRMYGSEGSNPSRAKKMGNVRRGDGARFKGRGHVQLTWAINYIKAGKVLGVDLYGNPKLALELETSARVLFQGCMDGWFTGRNLKRYISGKKCNFVLARYIVNGKDKAVLIAGYAQAFLEAIEAAMHVASDTVPEAVTPPAADLPSEPDFTDNTKDVPEGTTGKPMHKSTTNGAAIVTGVGGAVAAGKNVIDQVSETGTTLGLSTQTILWIVLAIAIVGAAGWIIRERWQKSHKGGQ